MFWLYVLAGVVVLLAALWWMDRRGTRRPLDPGTVARNVGKAEGKANRSGVPRGPNGENQSHPGGGLGGGGF